MPSKKPAPKKTAKPVAKPSKPVAKAAPAKKLRLLLKLLRLKNQFLLKKQHLQKLWLSLNLKLLQNQLRRKLLPKLLRLRLRRQFCKGGGP
jgi:hypothetical protein